jgi:uracil-DNA glycosylase family protein
MVRVALPTAVPFLPRSRSLATHAEAAQACRGCPLWKGATQAVFGEGPKRARVLMIGEQPGDQEDKQGRPFVGPAGRILDEALEAAGIDRDSIYVTNIVKHFKWKPVGKRRIHATPSRIEADACRPWFDRELELVVPEALVILGSTAAKELLGPSFKVTENRGRPLSSPLAPLVIATVHPSAILRARENRREEMTRFVDDLKAVAALLAAGVRRPA